MKQDLTKIFIDEVYKKSPKRNFETTNTVYNYIDEIWYIDRADFSDCKISKNKGFRYIFVIIDNFSDYLWCIPF